MKRAYLFSIFTLAALLSAGVTGCKKPEKGVTPIQGRAAKPPSGPGPGQPLDIAGKKPDDGGVGSSGLKPDGSAPTAGLDEFEGMAMDRSVFAGDTVYFDFDRSSVKKGETAKVENVAGYLKSNRGNKVLIEGHCDERGTEEYNRSLGERRALALREYLIRLGVDADRIRTLSYGEDKPAVPGHDDAAWSKNRRGEFVLLKPKN